MGLVSWSTKLGIPHISKKKLTAWGRGLILIFVSEALGVYPRFLECLIISDGGSSREGKKKKKPIAPTTAKNTCR
jgi:hypothetical protein